MILLLFDEIYFFLLQYIKVKMLEIFFHLLFDKSIPINYVLYFCSFFYKKFFTSLLIITEYNNYCKKKRKYYSLM